MTLRKRLRLGACMLASAAALAGGARASDFQALSADDAHAYVAAFDATERGDFIDAQMQAGAVQDKSLLGYLTFRQLMHPTAHVAAFDELAGWLARFRDLPVADRVFALASRRKTDPAAQAPAPVIELIDGPAAPPVSKRGRRAREAFYSGNLKRALALAPPAGERWIAGLAAYRLKDYGRARTWFADLAHDERVDAWTQSAAGYWGARSAAALGDSDEAEQLLKAAARYSETFYGMIAARQIELRDDAARQAAAERPTLILASYSPSADAPPVGPDLARFVALDTRAHRAAALAQIGRNADSLQELRAGLALAETPRDRGRWQALAQAMGTALADRDLPPRVADFDYPAPELTPRNGFTLDRALVYAIVRQESRFNPQAVSRSGAVGLMQLMPVAAAAAAGDDKLLTDTRPLFDPALNLRVGQDYMTWLLDRAVGQNLLRAVAAYNGGPSMVSRTADRLGPEADDLLLVECLPAQETRAYVQKVMAGYWTYRRMWGRPAATLDATAVGAIADPRLDLTQSDGAAAELATQPLQIGMR